MTRLLRFCRGQQHLLFLAQELGLGRAIREQENEESPGRDRDQTNDEEEPLPLSHPLRSLRGMRRSMPNAKRDERDDDLGKTVALERPSDTFCDFDPGVKHGGDEHQPWRYASLGGTEKDSDRN